MVHLGRVLRDQRPDLADVAFPSVFGEGAKEEDDLCFDDGAHAAGRVVAGDIDGAARWVLILLMMRCLC